MLEERMEWLVDVERTSLQLGEVMVLAKMLLSDPRGSLLDRLTLSAKIAEIEVDAERLQAWANKRMREVSGQ